MMMIGSTLDFFSRTNSIHMASESLALAIFLQIWRNWLSVVHSTMNDPSLIAS